MHRLVSKASEQWWTAPSLAFSFSLPTNRIVDSLPHQFVVMIGTNNIGSGHRPEPTSRGVVAVARWLMEKTRGKLLLVKLLPRGDHGKDGGQHANFGPAIDEVNEMVEAAIPALVESFGAQRIKLVDCNAPFLAPGGVRPELMPDMLHVSAQRAALFLQFPSPFHARSPAGPSLHAKQPNARGMELLAQCYQNALVAWHQTAPEYESGT